MNEALIFIDQAKEAISRITDLQEIKPVADRAEALRIYIKRSGHGLEMQNRCAEIRLRAERKAGELLNDIKKQGPGEYQRLHRETIAPSLSEMGISRIQSHRWQLMAGLPDDLFEAYLIEVRGSGREITSKGVYLMASKYKHDQKDIQGKIERCKTAGQRDNPRWNSLRSIKNLRQAVFKQLESWPRSMWPTFTDELASIIHELRITKI